MTGTRKAPALLQKSKAFPAHTLPSASGPHWRGHLPKHLIRTRPGLSMFSGRRIYSSHFCPSFSFDLINNLPSSRTTDEMMSRNTDHSLPGNYLSFGRPWTVTSRLSAGGVSLLLPSLWGQRETTILITSTIKMNFSLHHQDEKASLVWDEPVYESF